MKEFNLWYPNWIQNQELTINHLAVAEAAFKAGMECAQDKDCIERQNVSHNEINTHKGSF